MPRPAEICGGLLRALDASEGRRRRRKRNTTPDAIGLGLKRSILEDAVREDPEPEEFESWLMTRCVAAGRSRDADGEPEMPGSEGGLYAMARTILEEWSLAVTSPAFRDWLDRGAPSDDAPAEKEAGAGGDRRTDAAASGERAGKRCPRGRARQASSRER